MKTSGILLIVAILISGVVYYLIQTQAPAPEAVDIVENATSGVGAANTEADAPDAPDEAVESAPSGTGSFASLLSRGQALECEYQMNADTGSSVAGTSYIDGTTGRVRSDFAMQQAGEEYRSSMVMREEKVYTWTRSSYGDYALVMDVSTADAENTSETPPEQPVSLDDRIEYDCQPWTVDESKYELPTDVEFQSMDEMMQERMQGMPEDFEMPENMPR